MLHYCKRLYESEWKPQGDNNYYG